jgi:secernin
MCDTIVALPDATASRVALFGKNSDRERNEAQSVEFTPGADHKPGAELTCTYITIPQARRTHAALLCRPFWMWGAEMGANEHGVVIGNEAVHARTPPQEQPALTGMDLLRLALERAATAAEAVEVITTLLEQHGQGGSCGHLASRFYHNSFIVADPHQAYVVETMRRHWLVQRVTGVRSISNAYSIGRDADRVSAGLDAHIRDAGWRNDAAPGHASGHVTIDYATIIADAQRDTISQGRARCVRSSTLLQRRRGRLTALDMMAILRDHGAMAETDPDWHPQHTTTRTICMHAADGERGGQTVNSLVSELHAERAVHWVTGTAAPCISIFKPVFADAPPPAHGPRPTDHFDPRTLWWRHERLHRAMLGDFPIHLAAIRDERDALEADFYTRVADVLAGGDAADRAEIVAVFWAESIAVEDRWMAEIDAASPPGDAAYRASWLEMNRLAGVAA